MSRHAKRCQHSCLFILLMLLVDLTMNHASPVSTSKCQATQPTGPDEASGRPHAKSRGGLGAPYNTLMFHQIIMNIDDALGSLLSHHVQ